MAKVRFSHLDDFVLKDDGRFGIGTSLPAAKLEVVGDITAKNIKIGGNSGITTFSVYEGFQNKKTSYVENITVDGGESGSLANEIVVGAGLTMTVSTGATTGQGSIESVKVYNTFTPPIGFTTDRPSAPKAGSLFYNKDFKTIEFWDGNLWKQVDNASSMGRAVLYGGNRNPASASFNEITAYSMVTNGEEQSFGEAGFGNAGSGSGSRTRGVFLSGNGTTPAAIEYVTIASLGNSLTFGDSFHVAYRTGGSFSSETRAIWAGGRGNPGNAHTVIQYVEISTLGNSLEFGALQINGRGQDSGFSSPTRGFSCGNAPYTADIQMVTISSKGNALIWGDNTFAGAYQCGNSNSVRGSIAGGYQYPGANVENAKSYIIMASEGRAYDFGNLSTRRVGYAYGGSSQVRGFVAGGYDGTGSPHPSRKTIDSFFFESKGEIETWGDLQQGKRDGGSTTDCHGGLGGY